MKGKLCELSEEVDTWFGDIFSKILNRDRVIPSMSDDVVRRFICISPLVKVTQKIKFKISLRSIDFCVK